MPCMRPTYRYPVMAQCLFQQQVRAYLHALQYFTLIIYRKTKSTAQKKVIDYNQTLDRWQTGVLVQGEAILCGVT